MDWMPQAIREGIFTILFISGPLVILAAGLGLAIGIIQAATQVQEQTLGSAVKVIGLLLALIVFGFYMFQYVSKYTAENLRRAFKLVPSLGSYVLPRENFLSKPKETDELEPQAPPTTLAEQEPKTSGSSKALDAKNEPDQITNSAPNARDISTAIKESNQAKSKRPAQTNIQDQNLRPVTQVGVTPSKPRTQPVTNPQRQVSPPVQQAATRTPAPALRQEPVVTPAAPPTKTPQRAALADRLNGLRNSVTEVNRELQEAGR